MEDFGFVTITNYEKTDSAALISSLKKCMTDFMQLPLEEKEKFHGYIPASKRKDGKEAFDVRIKGISWPDEDGSLEGSVRN